MLLNYILGILGATFLMGCGGSSVTKAIQSSNVNDIRECAKKIIYNGGFLVGRHRH